MISKHILPLIGFRQTFLLEKLGHADCWLLITALRRALKAALTEDSLLGSWW